MTQSLPLFIGLRYIRSKRRTGFVSFVSGFSFGAMALGVMALIVVLSVMNGLAGQIYSRVLNVVPHMVLQTGNGEGAGLADMERQGEQLLRHNAVQAVAPFVQGYAMLRLQNRSEGVQVQGIDPAREQAVSEIDNQMLLGDFSLLAPGEFGAIIGSQTARTLGAVAGDRIRMTLPIVSATPMGVFAREKNITVIGVFEVGAQVDSGLVFLHLADAQRLYRRGDKVDGLRVRLAEPMAAVAVAQQLRAGLSEGYRLVDWQEQLGSLSAAIRMEKVVVGLLLAIVIAVAAFNIVANLVMMVSEKRKDIAVLRSMGTSAGQVVRIFMVQGTMTGLFGIAVGAVAGCLLGASVGDVVAWFEQLLGTTVFDPDVYYTTTLPSILLVEDVMAVCGGAVLMSLLATLYPAWQASRVQPAEALRYDH
ncbi:MAG: lipoprotein-releasing ABC transporter permease subunit [Porticoccaceae bacterium]|nr:lipoprotein-releasing ABC transporter permease subunit [Porticoccaceae bacterium]